MSNQFSRIGSKIVLTIMCHHDTIGLIRLEKESLLEGMKRNSITLILGQIVTGGILGLVGGWVCLFIFQRFIWGVLIGDRVSHGFWVGLFLLVAMSITYGVIVVGASVGMRFVSQKFGVDIPLKPLCSGAFLGPPAVVGLIALLNVPWEILGALVPAFLIPVFKTLAYIISSPIRGWMYLGLPVEIWYILAVPIGAILGYRIASVEDTDVHVEQT